MKVASVSLSQECIKKPRCSFCYAKETPMEFNSWKVGDALYELIKKWEDLTVSFEYSGFHLSFLSQRWRFNGVKVVTLTTMPQVISSVFCGFVKNHRISAIALSFDSEKTTVQEWIEKARLIKSVGLKVSCNALIEKVPLDLPVVLLKACDQLNLLTLKPTGRLKAGALKMLQLAIESYKSIVPVTVDNCLGVQLKYIDQCKAGVDFIHILPNGTVEDCCFKDKCFLYERGKT